jgi:hypothetical protein
MFVMFLLVKKISICVCARVGGRILLRRSSHQG